MVSSSFSMTLPIIKVRFFLFLCLTGIVSAQLSSNFYATTCPNALSTIKAAVNSAVSKETRMGASLLRLHFHDCFVQASQLSLSLSIFSLYFYLFLFYILFLKKLHLINICIFVLHQLNSNIHARTQTNINIANGGTLVIGTWSYLEMKGKRIFFLLVAQCNQIKKLIKGGLFH